VSGSQARELAAISDWFTDDPLRLTERQNFELSSVRGADLGRLHDSLVAVRLARPVADTVEDIIVGAPTNRSRRLARQLIQTFRDQKVDPAHSLRIDGDDDTTHARVDVDGVVCVVPWEDAPAAILSIVSF
jgi:sulfite reductase beta subunit-like hemoprotein